MIKPSHSMATDSFTLSLTIQFLQFANNFLTFLSTIFLLCYRSRPLSPDIALADLGLLL
jgi:hypothetical protein